MANTFSILDYNSTFGDWLVATNNLIKENNDLAANNYTKSSGTLFLNDTGLSLQTANTAIIGGQLLVQGTGSSAYVQNNLRVDGQIYFTNTVLGITNTGQANIGGPLLALGTGNALRVSNNATIGGTISVVGNGMFQNNITIHSNVYSTNVIANNTITTETLIANNVSIGSNVSVNNLEVLSVINASNADAYLSSLSTVGDISVGNKLSVDGDFQINGTIIYNTNELTINANNDVGIDSYFGVNRGTSGANSQIRWNESLKYWDILNVDSNNYYSILTSDLLSDATNSSSSSNIATPNAVNSANTQLKSYVDGQVTNLNNNITSANTQLKSYTDGLVSSANTQLKSYVDGYISSVTYVGTSGTAVPASGRITITSTNGITAAGSSNTITINTPQDLRTSASPTFAGLTLSSPLSIGNGGTGATSQSQALTNILPTGTTAGYVLTTGGPGTFYWSASAGGGGGATPGTTINSSRLFPTVNADQTIFSTPTYTPGASQLRVYINGVRQFNSEYTETSNTTVTLTTGCSEGDVVMLEVDGYINNPYYANNITLTVPFGEIVSTANTIQLAIQDLETRKATLLSPSLTGTPTAPTASAEVSNTQIATTGFANSLVVSANTQLKSYTDGLVTGGSANSYLRTIGVGTSPDTANVGSIVATGQITAYYSDENLKTRLGNIENALDMVSQLSGFYYEPNQTAQELGYSIKREVGVSAQEVNKVLPEVIAAAPIDNKYLTVHYERLIPLLIEAIKELKNEIDTLKGNN